MPRPDPRRLATAAKILPAVLSKSQGNALAEHNIDRLVSLSVQIADALIAKIDPPAAAQSSTTRQPISTAPRNGNYIRVGRDSRWFEMRWNEQVGMWVTRGGGKNWSDSPETGPTHWEPLSD